MPLHQALVTRSIFNKMTKKIIVICHKRHKRIVFTLNLQYRNDR